MIEFLHFVIFAHILFFDELCFQILQNKLK